MNDSRKTEIYSQKTPNAKPKDSQMPKISILCMAVSSNQFVIYIYKRASLASAARLAYTMCPPDAAIGRWGHID